MSQTPDTVVGDQARDRILDAAQELFAADGFDATSTARIAQHAGVGKGLLFYYFPKKDEVLRSLLAERLRSTLTVRAVDVAIPGDVTGSLDRLAHRLELASPQHAALRAIVFREASTHPEARVHGRNFRLTLRDLIEEVIIAAATESVSRPTLRVAANAYLATLLDHSAAAWLDVPGPDLHQVGRLIAAALERIDLEAGVDGRSGVRTYDGGAVGVGDGGA